MRQPALQDLDTERYRSTEHEDKWNRPRGSKSIVLRNNSKAKAQRNKEEEIYHDIAEFPRFVETGHELLLPVNVTPDKPVIDKGDMRPSTKWWPYAERTVQSATRVSQIEIHCLRITAVKLDAELIVGVPHHS